MNFILEGADVDQKNVRGKKICAGWRHYKMIFGGRSANVISTPEGIAASAARYAAKLFPRGTWEDFQRDPLPGSFHFVRLDIAEEIYALNTKAS